MSPVAMTIECTAAAIGEQIFGFLARRVVLQRARELHRSAQPLSLVEVGPGLVCYNNEVILIAGLQWWCHCVLSSPL